MQPREVWPPADLRAGDADRKSAVAELQRHFVDGRLTSEELSERITAALQARTFGELRALLSDLPALSDHSELAPAAGGDWKSQLQPPWPLGGALILVGVLAVLWLLVATTSGHGGFLPIWPVLFFFFVFGRPFRGGRRRF